MKLTEPRGKALESAIIASAAYAPIVLEKTQPGFVMGRNGTARAVNGLPDFVGVFRHGGRAIIFDAKMSANDAGFPMDKLKPHQARTICRWGASGAIAGLMLQHGESYYWLAWPDVERIWLRGGIGHSAVPWATMKPMGDWKHMIDFQRLLT